MRALRRSQSSSSKSSPPPSSSHKPLSPPSLAKIHLRSVLFIVASSTDSSPASSSSSDRYRRKSPWSRRKRKNILLPHQWESLFTMDGRIRDNGVKFLKKVRSGGVDPTIRPEVWPFLLGVYGLRSTKEERDAIMSQKRKEYELLRRECRKLLKQNSKVLKLNESSSSGVGGSISAGMDSPDSEDVTSAREESLSGEEEVVSSRYKKEDVDPKRGDSSTNGVASDSDSSDSDSSDDPTQTTFNLTEGADLDPSPEVDHPEGGHPTPQPHRGGTTQEDFCTWQRIIRLDAIRNNGEWVSSQYYQEKNPVSEGKAFRAAEMVGLKDYEHMDPAKVLHAARLVSILEAYAVYDPEIGYCQGMSDLLSPIITVMSDDNEAFWCFVGFMRKARHNFRLDEMGIRRQLNLVSKIIKYKDSHLYRHLEKLEAEDCFFVYRMVVVLFRRELTLEQTLCLWEVMWADQAAVRAGIGKSAWSKIRQRVPPTDDLLLYAIAASVLQRRKQIIEKYNSMDEILRECNGMTGQLDVWKLLDDAHNLVVTLHDKIETPL